MPLFGTSPTATRARQLIKRALFTRRYMIGGIERNCAGNYGLPLDRAHPRTFAAKVSVAMIRAIETRDGSKTAFADKLAVRDHICWTIGERYLNTLLWEGKSARDIPFDTLPSSYVLKPNHASGVNVVVRGEIDRAAVIRRLDSALAWNFYYANGEYQYRHIRPRLLVEACLDDGEEYGPFDYKIWCFDGEPAMVQVDNSRHINQHFYTTDWQRLNLAYRQMSHGPDKPRPARLDEMLGVARTLSRTFDFVRVDLFQLPERVVFGELTFTPMAGNLRIQPAEWDLKLGEMWR